MWSTGRPRTRAGEAGFTLLELLIAMTLLAMLTVAASFWIPDISDRIAVDRAADVLERELARVAATAARSGSDQILTLQRTGSSLTLVTPGKALELDPDLDARWIAAAELGSTTNQGSVAFWGRGGASGGAFEISRGTASAAIEIDWLTARVARRK